MSYNDTFCLHFTPNCPIAFTAAFGAAFYAVAACHWLFEHFKRLLDHEEAECYLIGERWIFNIAGGSLIKLRDACGERMMSD
jgi:hypothetical protein